jgi:hypothetical protein
MRCRISNKKDELIPVDRWSYISGVESGFEISAKGLPSFRKTVLKGVDAEAVSRRVCGCA